MIQKAIVSGLAGVCALGLAACATFGFSASAKTNPGEMPAPVRQERVRVPIGGGMTLTGTLHTPALAHNAPAAILFPGSQASRNLSGLAEHLASQGIIALDLNKRGVDGSDGHWRDETIPRLAEDALSAVAYLQTAEGADPARIGIIGHSQGGWVAQLAAARSSGVAFIVLLAGPTQTVKDQILTDERNHLTGWGVPASEVEERISMFAMLLEAALANPGVCGPSGGHYLCGLFGYDPAEALARIEVPVLALYGERDPMTPPDLNREPLAAALTSLDPDKLTTHVFPEANHMFWRSGTGLRDEYARIDRVYVPGFLDTVSDWISAVGTERQEPAPSGH